MISILVAGIVAFAFGAAWFMGPIGKVWLNSKIWAEENRAMTMTPKYMTRMYAVSFALTVLTAYVLDVFFQITGVTTLAQYLQMAMLLCFGFVIVTKFNDMIYTNTPPFYGKRAQLTFIIDVGYYIGMFAIMAVVLYYL